MSAPELMLYALAWAATLLIGGVHPIVEVGLAAGALALLLAVGLGPGRKQGTRIVPLTWVMLAALAWTALQLLPMPLSLLALLSPAAAAVQAEVGATLVPITLDRAATALELVKQLGYFCVFVVGVELLRTRDATRRAAIALAVLGLCVAGSIFVHRGLGLTRFFGLYEPSGHPGSGYFAPFVNGNHAASLLALGALCALGLAAASQRIERIVWLAAAGGTAVALLMTMSRGGALCFALGGFVLGSVLASVRFGRARGLVLSSVLLVVVGTGALLLSDGLRSRFAVRTADNSNFSNQKTRAWAVALRLGDRYPLVGVGRGAFEAPAAALRIEHESIRLNYAENFALQAVSTWGWPMSIALLGAAFLCLLAAARRLPIEPELVALQSGLLAVAGYGLLDCGFEIPGVMMPFALALAAVAARAESEGRSRRRARPRVGAVSCMVMGALGALVVLGAARAVPRTLDEDAARLRAAMLVRPAAPAEDLDLIVARHPASADLEMLAGQVALSRNDGTALHHLGRAMRLQPSLPRPHELAAIELLRLRRPAQAALEYRMGIERGTQLRDDVLVRYLGPFAIDAVPRTAEALLNMGGALAQAGRWNDASVAFQRAEELGGGAAVRTARMSAFDHAPDAAKRDASERMAKEAKDGDELALALRALSALKAYDRVDALYAAQSQRYAGSALLIAEVARSRAARGDLDGARRLLGKSSRFELPGRVLLAELAVELAHRAGDVDGVAAATARLRLLRAKVDLEQPSARTNP